MEEEDKKIIANREILLTFEPPTFSFTRGVLTKLTCYDLICIYRQIKNNNIKNQMKKFIKYIDEQQGIKTDIDNIELPRKYKEPETKRDVTAYDYRKQR